MLENSPSWTSSIEVSLFWIIILTSPLLQLTHTRIIVSFSGREAIVKSMNSNICKLKEWTSDLRLNQKSWCTNLFQVKCHNKLFWIQQGKARDKLINDRKIIYLHSNRKCDDYIQHKIRHHSQTNERKFQTRTTDTQSTQNIND
jgi:hypothetical protein